MTMRWASYWWADAVEELDYYVMHGRELRRSDARISALTGPAPMLPKWAFGYMQSKERYVTCGRAVRCCAGIQATQGAAGLHCAGLEVLAEWGGLGSEELRSECAFPSRRRMMHELHAIGRAADGVDLADHDRRMCGSARDAGSRVDAWEPGHLQRICGGGAANVLEAGGARAFSRKAWMHGGAIARSHLRQTGLVR